jgi:phosphatidylethanolamine-binding protein (PEBP) family uncharacterized protein/cytochrome c2
MQLRLAATLFLMTVLAACGPGASTPQQPTRLLADAVSTTPAASYNTVVQQLYVAYFGRPADSSGLSNFTTRLSQANAGTTMASLDAAYTGNATIRELINAFGTSAESAALYSGGTEGFVKAIYLNVFNRTADTAGLAFWVNEIDRNGLARGKAALSIMNGSLTNGSAQSVIDAAVVTNKTAVAAAFTTSLASDAQRAAYSGNTAAASARSMLATVTSSTVTSTFQSTINSTIASLVANASFTLSSSAATDGGTLSSTYTCDGSSSTLPLSWSSPPTGTTSFALIMSTIPGPGSVKYNWLLYNIPATTTALATNSSGVGTLGFADDGAGLAYAPPCSSGSGTKYYTYTLYALSGAPELSAYSASQVTGAVLSTAIAARTLGSAAITLANTRTQATLNCQSFRQSIGAYEKPNSLSLTCDDTYAYFSTYGIQTAHAMMNGITQTILQVPIAQNFTGSNAWKIPLVPAIAASTTTAVDGPIGIAVNGIPIFNPCKQGGCDTATGGGDTKVQGELDICNGHAGRADDYHYHAAPTCMMADQPTHYWDTHPLGWALDGFGIFGYYNPDGTVATRDTTCGGNTLAHQGAPSGYAYHVTDTSPYILSCFRGTPSPDLAGQGGKFAVLRQPVGAGGGAGASAMTLNATAASLAIGGTTTLSWTNSGTAYQVLYTRTTSLCWTFVFKTAGVQTATQSYCRAF